MILKNPAFSNVVQTGVALCKVPLGEVINGLQLKFSGTAIDPTNHVKRIVVRINTKIAVDLSGAQAETIHAAKGLAADATTIYLDFLEMTALTMGSMFTGAHDTSKGCTSYDIEVHFDGAPADVGLVSYRDVSAAAENSPGLYMIRAYVPQTLSFTGSGKYSHQPSVGASRPAKVMRLHFLGSTVDAIGIKKNGVHVFENIPAAENAVNLAYWGRDPQANHYMVDFVPRGIIEEGLYTGNARSLEYEVETSGAGDVTLITEQVIALGDL